MKVAMVGQKGIPTRQGGVERHVEHLALELVALGVDVVAYTRPRYTPRALRFHGGVRLVSLPSIATKHLDAITHVFLAMLHALFVEKVDVIHVHAIGPSLLTFLPRLLAPRVRVVSTFHALDMEHGKWGRLARLTLRLGARCACLFPHATIAVSMKIRDYCERRCGRDAAYVPYGVAPGDLDPATAGRAQSILAELGLRPQSYVLAVTRLVRHKGVHRVIAAFKAAQARRPDLLADQRLVVVGDGAFTDCYTEELRRLAEGDETILFLGERSGTTLSVLFAHASLYVSGSESEGLSIASLEAMAYGLPVVVSNIPENLELFLPESHDRAGYVFRNGDDAHLAQCLEEVLADRDRAAERGRQARAIIERHHALPEVARRVARVYQLASA